ncbi:hypothetical protein MMC20_006312 [Loxospora ochrophaea]|nr:hypothetical protein [Loxospora ochrophaea]
MTSPIEFVPTPLQDIPMIVEELRSSFIAGKTRPIAWRKAQLKRFWHMIDDHEAELRDALFLDIGKPKFEAQTAEITALKNESMMTLTSLDDWLEPVKVPAPTPGGYQAKICKQPKGVCVSIGAWNYPVLLTLLPLVGMIAGGNAGLIKPSELAPNCAMKAAELIPQYLDPTCFKVVNGGKEAVQEMLEHPFGHIMYTGGGVVGSIVMRAAAKHLTPVTLELGGKSPAIVSDKANIELAAKRIAWGKFVNSGQTCVAPDYALVQEDVMPEFLNEMKKVIHTTYEKQTSGHIINNNHWKRINSLLSSTKGKILIGGTSDEPALYISPTVVTSLPPSDPLLETEIFGPILPILPYSNLPHACQTISQISDSPLAIYIMTEDVNESEFVIQNTQSGGANINDVMAQVVVPNVPFGGFGKSGFGEYGGKYSVDLFSHHRSVVTVPTTKEFEAMVSLRYPGGDMEEKFRFWKGHLEAKLVNGV